MRSLTSAKNFSNTLLRKPEAQQVTERPLSITKLVTFSYVTVYDDTV